MALSGLQPNTHYFYQLFSGIRPLSKIASFHTNHAADDTEFSFLVFGDSGTGRPEMHAVADLILASGTSFGLHTGDVIYFSGAEELYDPNFFFPYAPYLAANVIYSSLGNHDLLTANGAPFLTNFFLPSNNPIGTERYYSFDYGHAHFVALDTNLPLAAGSAQLAWLEQDLITSTKPWNFVFFHFPPYSAGIQVSSGNRIELEHPPLRRSLIPLLERYGVDIVFSGHAHSYERTFPILQNQPTDVLQEPNYISPAGPIYVVTGGGGGNLTELGSSSLNAQAIVAPHIVEISLSANELIGRAIAPPGEIIDEFRVQKQ